MLIFFSLLVLSLADIFFFLLLDVKVIWLNKYIPSSQEMFHPSHSTKMETLETRLDTISHEVVLKYFNEMGWVG